MTEECPSNNMTCVLTVLAEVQAVTDQLVGTAEALSVRALSLDLIDFCEAQMKLARFLQATLDAYAVQHTPPNADFTVRGARKLRHALAL